MLAYTYPLLNLFWSMLVFFGFFLWIWLLIVIFSDLFRSRDISGFAKAMWFLLVLFLPLVGVLIYLIARGNKMQARAAEAAQQQEEEFRSYVKDVSGDGSTTEKLTKLADLHDRGVLTDQEFDNEKAKLLAG